MSPSLRPVSSWSSLSSSSSSTSSSFSLLSPTASLFTPSARPTISPSLSAKLDGNWRTNASPPPCLPTNIVVGGIYLIPEQHKINADSLIHSNLAFNAGAFGHPFLVVAEQDGIATVLCITSKEQTARKHPGQHVAIGGTHYNLPSVQLVKGAMAKQSFIKTSEAYQIECENLEPFYRRGGTVPQIDAGSMGLLVKRVAALGRMPFSDAARHGFVHQHPYTMIPYHVNYPHHHFDYRQHHHLVDTAWRGNLPAGTC